MMNQEDVFKKIGSILNEINDQYEFLAQNPAQLNELELELFLANASFLTDHIQILQKINNSKPVKAITEHSEVAAPVAAPVPEPEKVILLPEVPEINAELDQDIFKLDNEPSSFEFILSEGPLSDKFDFEEKPLNEIFDRPLSEEEQQIILQKQKLHHPKEEDLFEEEPLVEDEIGPEPFLVPKQEEPVLIEEEERPVAVEEPVVTEEPEPAEELEEIAEVEELAIEEPEPVQVAQAPAAIEIPVAPVQEEPATKPTLNELLANSLGVKPTVQTESAKQTISDLKQGITLNDKLLYIKDLFNGYNLAYAEAIDLLNKMADFNTADSFLQKNYAVKNNWTAKQSTADQFYEVLRQRFPI
ncbi:hypothetical protein LPB86_08480 [Pedobacter sp. MC2016-14]|uniref:hypothetical protein n=1 Tax=Pedobacter sp. MC2016-14 TaxID=2897327 RepID=UPI001E635BE0|nr:hypothetical protein [Pedobacter sp. MC2016-14]MCD0488262.1 hypothetical protein [Pedobacter sp. MC2016-14]